MLGVHVRGRIRRSPSEGRGINGLPGGAFGGPSTPKIYLVYQMAPNGTHNSFPFPLTCISPPALFLQVRRRVPPESYLNGTHNPLPTPLHIDGLPLPQVRRRVPPEAYIPLIDAYIHSHPDALIFLATDDTRYHARMRRRYGASGRLVTAETGFVTGGPSSVTGPGSVTQAALGSATARPGPGARPRSVLCPRLKFVISTAGPDPQAPAHTTGTPHIHPPHPHPHAHRFCRRPPRFHHLVFSFRPGRGWGQGRRRPFHRKCVGQ